MADSDAQSPDGPGPPPEAAPPPAPRRSGLLRDPWFRFAALFGLLALSCEILYYAVLVDSGPLQHYLRALASVAGWILSALGFDVGRTDTVLTFEGFAVEIAHGCDAIQICALYSCSVVAFPVGLRRKILGLLVGIAWLQLLNQVRIMSLVLIGHSHADWFETAHYTVWPTFLIVVTVLSWMVWVRWATREQGVNESNAA